MYKFIIAIIVMSFLIGEFDVLMSGSFGAEDPIRPIVHSVLNTKRDHTYLQRIEAISHFPRHLNEAESTALIQLLFSPPTADTTLSIEAFATVKNDITDILCADRRYMEVLAENLVTMSSIEELGSTWNCFCIQYFAQVYPRATDSSKILLRETIDAVLSHCDHIKAGTALIALSNITEHCPEEITSAYLTVRAWTLYTADTVSNTNKPSAFHILGDLGNVRILHESRKILKNTTFSKIPYLVASLAILGKHGSKSDIFLIEYFTKHADLRIRTAAAHGLKALRKRLNHDH